MSSSVISLGSFSPTRKPTSALRLVVVWLLVCPLAGCFGDPPPDPATAPLEVILDECTLNRPDVAPGTHQVDVFRYEGQGPGVVVVTDEDAQQVLSVDSGGGGELVTTEQTYTFSCTIGGAVNTTTLTSKP